MDLKEEYQISCSMTIQCTLCGYGERVDGKREANRIMKEHFKEKHGMK